MRGLALTGRMCFLLIPNNVGADNVLEASRKEAIIFNQANKPLCRLRITLGGSPAGSSAGFVLHTVQLEPCHRLSGTDTEASPGQALRLCPLAQKLILAAEGPGSRAALQLSVEGLRTGP